MIKERTAVHYGRVELIRGVPCDGYVLDNNAVAISEQSTADLLGIDQETLNVIKENELPETTDPLFDEEFTLTGVSVKVAAKSSPDFGKNIIVYTGTTIETLIRTYALAFINKTLSEDQMHIGERALTLFTTLVENALSGATKEASGIKPTFKQPVTRKKRVSKKRGKRKNS